MVKVNHSVEFATFVVVAYFIPLLVIDSTRNIIFPIWKCWIWDFLPLFEARTREFFGIVYHFWMDASPMLWKILWPLEMHSKDRCCWRIEQLLLYQVWVSKSLRPKIKYFLSYQALYFNCTSHQIKRAKYISRKRQSSSYCTFSPIATKLLATHRNLLCGIVINYSIERGEKFRLLTLVYYTILPLFLVRFCISSTTFRKRVSH